MKKWYIVFRNAAGHQTSIFIDHASPTKAIDRAVREYADLMMLKRPTAAELMVEFGSRD